METFKDNSAMQLLEAVNLVPPLMWPPSFQNYTSQLKSVIRIVYFQSFIIGNLKLTLKLILRYSNINVQYIE